MPDSYVLVGSALALLASVLLICRDSKPKQDKFTQEMLRIGEQMKMYKQAAACPATSLPSPHHLDNKSPASFPGKRVTILFGSQTGTAEGFAEVLKNEGRTAGFQTQAIDLEDYDAASNLPDEHLVILVLATYGEGDPTDNAVAFLHYLRDRDGYLHDETLQNVQYTVFGLGNRQYEHYNAIGRAVDRLMAKHGAQRVFPYGEGDDNACLDEDFDEWKEKLWQTLQTHFLPAKTHEESTETTVVSPEYEYKLVAIQAPNQMTTSEARELKMKASTKHFFTAKEAKIIVNRELCHSSNERSTVHIEFDLKGLDLTYQTADNLAVLPENDTTLVESVATRFNYRLEQWISLQAVDKNKEPLELPFPSPCTIRTILTQYLAINSAPRKGPLKQLAVFATDASERAQLLHLASKDGKQAYQTWILDDERSFVDVFNHFGSIQLSIQALLHLVPFLQPRYYTISSSSLVNPERLHATISVLTRHKKDGRVFRGVCSNYLSKLHPLAAHKDDKPVRNARPGEQGVKKPRQWPRARIFVRPSSFRLPTDPKTPIILIGPGTGLAPMRAFLHERAQQQRNGVALGPAILYFGCRRRDHDFIYQDELELFQATGVLTELHLAFSREQKDKIYVQHLLKQQGEATWQFMGQFNAHLYVCGATSMGNDVHKALHEIIQDWGHESTAQAQATLEKWQQEHRYIQELWA